MVSASCLPSHRWETRGAWREGFCLSLALDGQEVVLLAQAGLCVCFKSLAAFQTPGPGDPTVGKPADFCLEKTS